MEAFSLLTTPWLPVRYKGGSTGKLAPVDLANENVVDLTASRADLQGAGWQFLIGLLQTACAPKDIEEWEEIWEDGLTAEYVRNALLPLETAFQFGSVTPSFMQDFSPLVGDAISIATLLPETPGGQTTKLNKDHFVKRGVSERFCPHCAALALFSLQLNAPSGGKGYRTGLRGGGPMTTLIELQRYKGERQTPLWRKLWLNVMPQDAAGLPIPSNFAADIFPWLAETRTSEQANGITTEQQVNPLQAYWGMPRRIRLNFSTLSSGQCDICGDTSEALLSEMTVKNYGVNYIGWVHPLTPHRLGLKEGSELFSVKGQPGGLIWRDWLGLNVRGQSEHNHEYPARVVSLFGAYPVKERDVVTGLWGFGYDFDNMKVRNWYEHHFPLLLLVDTERETLHSFLRQAAQSASRGLSQLRGALKDAWFGEGSSARGDFGFIDVDFWQLTQPLFLRFIQDLEAGEDPAARFSQWQRDIRGFVRQYFDDRVFTSPEMKSDLKQVMKARNKHFSSLEKKSKAKTTRTAKPQEAN
ncbi:type I-E CRISPR-associated protein Cse1/CasA [Scandinavium lactucae]|uniref:Type I-E CRISPR-associated protein Cse1/CasA n=1 Tax=Scandinavium lactucae TaxID=3095028 RepID=A0ABU4QR22_9ENTR|nr:MULTISPECIES: type I-E CRISPR-associated protein Cse1/CasA [unclassified Scandinavium]MDX6041736.1 type I-E CRISPR-associated protein Cse1/CasA [Scandinavium sp. V105_6]MDX6051351.1 type I-E CRISPR-associated protein Cse1/CasA [Scandinavium sp. V105_1]